MRYLKASNFFHMILLYIVCMYKQAEEVKFTPAGPVVASR